MICLQKAPAGAYLRTAWTSCGTSLRSVWRLGLMEIVPERRLGNVSALGYRLSASVVSWHSPEAARAEPESAAWQFSPVIPLRSDSKGAAGWFPVAADCERSGGCMPERVASSRRARQATNVTERCGARPFPFAHSLRMAPPSKAIHLAELSPVLRSGQLGGSS